MSSADRSGNPPPAMAPIVEPAIDRLFDGAADPVAEGGDELHDRSDPYEVPAPPVDRGGNK